MCLGSGRRWGDSLSTRSRASSRVRGVATRLGSPKPRTRLLWSPPEAGQQTNQTVLAALFETSRPEFVECPSCRAGGAARKIDHTISLPSFVLVVANKNKARMRHTTSKASLKLRFIRRKKEGRRGENISKRFVDMLLIPRRPFDSERKRKPSRLPLRMGRGAKAIPVRIDDDKRSAFLS